MIEKRTERTDIDGLNIQSEQITVADFSTKKISRRTVIGKKNKNGEIETLREYETERIVR